MKIAEHILANSDCYRAGRTIVPRGIMVHSLGVAQPDARVIMAQWDRPGARACVHALVDADGVYQTLPWTHRGWHAGVGTTGQSANNTHISLECCEPAGHTYQGGTMVGYDPARHQAFFEAVYENAAQLCAWLCLRYGLDPLEDGVLLCHSEGYARGIASNHADVMHWWPRHGRSMDTFRARVRELMKEEEGMTQEQFDGLLEDWLRRRSRSAPGDWSREARQWAEENGLLRGDDRGEKRYQSYCTREELAAVLHRLAQKLERQ